MNPRTLPLLAVVFLTTACAAPRRPGAELRPPPAPPARVAPAAAVTGSLWSNGPGSLVGDNKARQVDDILTVAIFESASATKQASTTTGRDSSIDADISSVLGLEKNLANINSTIDPTNLLSAGYKSDFSGSGATSRKENLVATLTTRVVEVQPNGNLRIEGSKTVTVNREDQVIHLRGIVRPADIGTNNMVDSKFILDAEIVYTGNGVISDKQGQGWLTRIFDHIWPF
jgi:flagellar L-ring protein FlgH